ncbi:MAG: glycosyltransferase family 39 protein [candidate division NC10 bacterium]|nr:glycosyltransferase family 39 protein [candidate division NC10 bacterium]
MALQIASLKEFPLYCWEAQYAGAPNSYAAAVIFWFFGPGFVQLRTPMVLAALASSALYYCILGRLFTQKEALVGTLFFVFSPFLVLYHTSAGDGVYGETLLGIALIIWVSWQLADREMQGHLLTGWLLLLGFLCGFFFYVLFLVFPAIVAFALPSLRSAPSSLRRKTAAFATGGLIGISPLLLHNVLLDPGGTALRAAGRSLAVGRADLPLSLQDLIWKIINQKMIYLWHWLLSAPRLFGYYVLPEGFDDAFLQMAGVALIALLIAFGVIMFTRRRAEIRNNRLLRQFVLLGIFLVLFQWAANLDRPRHLLPLIFLIPVACFAVTSMLPRLRTSVSIGLLLLALAQLLGWLPRLQIAPLDPYPIARILRANNIQEFYGSYDTVYPLVFSTQEQIVGAPLLLPQNGILVDRRPEYTQRVLQSSRPAVLFRTDESALEQQFLAFLETHDVRFRSVGTESIKIYFDFSRRIFVESSTSTGTRFLLNTS